VALQSLENREAIRSGFARPRRRAAAACAIFRRVSMLDLIMLALGLALFVAAVGYTYACERL